MDQHCTAALRRTASIGAAVAIVAASSAFGIGATAATAATNDRPVTTSTTSTTSSTSSTDPTTTGTAAASDGADAIDTDTDPATGTPEDASADTSAGTSADATTSAGTSADPTTNAGTTTNTDTGTNTDTTTSTNAGTDADTDAAAPADDPTAPAAATPITWADPSTEQDPIVLTTTAGQPFSHTFTAEGGNGPLEYRFDPRSTFDTGWHWDERTGVLSGTPLSTIDSTVLFAVTATDQQQSAVQYVQVDVLPGTPVGLALGVMSDTADLVWTIDPDGTVRRTVPGSGVDEVVPEITATDRTTLTVAGLAVDAWGNRTTPGDAYPRSSIASTNAADVVVWDGDANRVTLSGTGARTLTISEGGVSTEVRVVVADPQPVGFQIGVALAAVADTGGSGWSVDGDTITRFGADGTTAQVDAIAVQQGDRVLVRALAVDAEGQPVGEHADLSITSDVASDRIVYDAERAATWITFDHASPHTVTITLDGVTQSIPFEVTPTAVPAATTPTVGSTTPTASGHLAYTGADESGTLAWALGLLAAGGGLLVHRIRRRPA